MRSPSGWPLGVVSCAVTANPPDWRTSVGTWSVVRCPGASVWTPMSEIDSPRVPRVLTSSRTSTATGRSLRTVRTSGASLEARL